MKVSVHYFASARELVGTKEEIVELGDNSTVESLLDSLVKIHGERLRDYLYDHRSGQLRASIQFLIGDKPVSMTGGVSTVLPDGVVFAIIPPVGGG